ncbi:MAG TPA: DUF5655 domain-containing protein [Thermoplasmata archaeon]|nr:DUF5655 domain-containing protein [Thermoplasmata archaeon]
MAMSARLLQERTGARVEEWNRRIRARAFAKPEELEEWLDDQGVHGYARSLLVMERFGYPDFVRASADELIDRQYSDRPHLRPIYEAIVAAAGSAGPIVVQARKGFVALRTPRRTFARIRATTRNRVDLGLRVSGIAPRGRFRAARIHPSLSVEVGLTTLGDLDDEVRTALVRSYLENR